MTYLTKEEFLKLGFEDVEDFEKLLARASLTIDLYLKNFYDFNDFETDFNQRKQSVKKAVAYQIAYLDSSGLLTAEDKTSLSSMTVGRTHVSYQNGSKSSHDGKRFNLSLDALNWLTLAGFGCKAVDYDR
ncbi:putative head-tail connector protein [Streptococcus phage SW24]|uniref:Putative head-tail connector protein n=1 Tax=Streptococcus phage SW24 TaxID=2483877 RepID=A0A3S7W858_9CAUD|nr:head-tail adaptor [Streptococcus phage SW24]AYP28637.1 putative head-tail connector protein [Streptococcus phage SW24]